MPKEKESQVATTDKKGYLDKLQEKVTSRKLLIMVVATLLVSCGKVDGDHWSAIALAYIGIEGAADIATRWKHGNISSK
jgi:hypothetical protein